MRYEVEESVYEEGLLLHNSTRLALHGLSSLLAEISVSEAVGGKLFEKLQGLVGKFDLPYLDWYLDSPRPYRTDSMSLCRQ